MERGEANRRGEERRDECHREYSKAVEEDEMNIVLFIDNPCLS